MNKTVNRSSAVKQQRKSKGIIDPDDLGLEKIDFCNVLEGRYDPDASSATCYAWFVWDLTTTPLHPHCYCTTSSKETRCIEKI